MVHPGLCRHVVALDKKLYSALSLFALVPNGYCGDHNAQEEGGGGGGGGGNLAMG